MDLFKNFAKSTLTSGINAGATVLSVQAGHGARFPAAPFNAVIWNRTNFLDPADDPNVEVIRVTGKATDTFTITRAQEGTADVAHNAGGATYGLMAPLTAKSFDDIPFTKYTNAIGGESPDTAIRVGTGPGLNDQNLDARRMWLGQSNHPGSRPQGGDYMTDLSIWTQWTGNPNARAKWIGIYVYNSFQSISASTASSQDLYAIDVENGIFDPAGAAWDFFTCYGIHSIAYHDSPGQITDGLIGVFGRARAYNSGDVNKLRGVQGWAETVAGSTADITAARGVYGVLQHNGTGVMTVGSAGYFEVNTNAGTIPVASGVRIGNQAIGGSGTSKVGLYIDAQTVATPGNWTNVWNLFSAGTSSLNVFQGPIVLGIGLSARMYSDGAQGLILAADMTGGQIPQIHLGVSGLTVIDIGDATNIGAGTLLTIDDVNEEIRATKNIVLASASFIGAGFFPSAAGGPLANNALPFGEFYLGLSGNNYTRLCVPLGGITGSREAMFPDADTKIAIAPQRITVAGMTAGRTWTVPDASFSAARIDAGQAFAGINHFAALINDPFGLTDAATIATDASLSNHFRVTLGGNRTLGNPTNPTDGQRITWEFIQDGTGSRTITLASKFAFGADITGVTLSTAAGARDFMTAIYISATDKFYIVGFVKGY